MGKIAFDPGTGIISHMDGARTVWRSDAPPAFLLGDNATITASVTIEFPDLVKGNAMYMFYSDVEFPPGNHNIGTAGQTWCVIRPQEWGPDESGGYNLPRQLLGIVPAGCNYLEVTANLTCIKTPTIFEGLPDFRYGFPEGQIVDLDGGFALLERQQYALMRGIGVVQIGTSLYLERYQSVKAHADCLTDVNGNSIGQVWKTGTQSWDGSPTVQWGNLWTDDGDRSGWLAKAMSKSEGSGNFEKMRGGPYAPSTTDITDFSSTWAGTLTIRPGYVKPS